CVPFSWLFLPWKARTCHLRALRLAFSSLKGTPVIQKQQIGVRKLHKVCIEVVKLTPSQFLLSL
ncbi:hypothetical protein, partial [Alkalibacterium putridalgicola]|uniref:hypothetical protein n=1 Tax=Alkalibacterium putridalgicola TaxID=426703 RepID=UPI001C4308BC